MSYHLHPIDAFGIEKVSLSGIRVERLEDRLAPGVPFPHKHDFFQLLLMTHGSGSHQIDFVNHKVNPKQMFVMKPGQMHSWQMKKEVKGILIEFSYQSLNAITEGHHLLTDLLNSPDVIQLPSKDYAGILNLAQFMLKESREKAHLSDLGLQTSLTTFLILLARLNKSGVRQEKTLSKIERFRDLVEKHFRSAHHVEFYAKELRTSSKALTMQLSRSIGKPPRQIIYERIILEAKRYLAFSELSVAEIGYELGFDDPNYFTRFFRVHEKKSPAVFRKEVTQDLS